MKKLSTVLFGLAVSFGSFSQDSYDFDNYNAGDYLGELSPDWTTWSGSTGGSEDVQINDTKSYSGSNSIYFSSNSADGGPQDVLLNFGGGVLSNGVFTFESMFFVEDDNAGYFNFQASATPGESYASSCYMDDDGMISFSPNTISGTALNYQFNEWFKLKIVADLTLGTWELFVNDLSRGTWQNDINEIASLDIYPVNPTNMGSNTNSSFWMDDVSWDFTPNVLSNLNLAVTSLNVNDGIASQKRSMGIDVINLGSTTITSFDVNISYNGNNYSESVSGVSISSYETYTHDFSSELKLVSGNNAVVGTISNVNGLSDDILSDDSKTIYLNPVVPAPGKLVIGEEATGTWCGWCPRGAVGLDVMERDYHDFFMGIAVHNGDPMVVTDYDSGIGGLISGYPSGLVDRGADIDPSEFEAPFLQRLVEAPAATIVPSAVHNTSANTIDVTLDVTFSQAISGDWRMACILTEDNVTGTSSGYAQSNYYSSSSSNISLIGTDGVDYMNLPNPVPASSMVYHHVARDIQPGFEGAENSFPGSVSAGESFTFNYNFNVDSDIDLNYFNVVGILIDNTGKIDNGGRLPLYTLTGIKDDLSLENSISLYPNPTNSIALLNVKLVDEETLNVRIVNMGGQTVTERKYGKMEGEFSFPLNTDNLSKGIYLIEVEIGTELKTLKMVKE